jgi:WhiB family redox-sensing transcriptional regulator
LKWALANPHLTPTGVWAATTQRDRNRLRRNLRERLGDDWIGVVAERDRRRRERKKAARLAPPTTVREAVTARPGA